MRPAVRNHSRKSRALPKQSLSWLAVAALIAGAQPAMPEQAALEIPAPRLVNFETANMLPDGTWSLQAGSHQTGFGTGAGTGSQVYYGALDWAASDDLTFGFTTQVQEDTTVSPIGGINAPVRFLTAGVSGKYRFYDSDRLDVAAIASVEALQFRTLIFGTDVANADHVIGSLQLPVTYQASPGLQLHFTPGVSVFPDSLNGFDYYGTVGFVGAGATWQPNRRLQLYGALNMPVTGGNTIDTSQAISKNMVYTAGVRYAFTPKVTLEGYVTNAVGVSPATGILTFWPDGDEPLIGLKVNYTPNGRFPDTYRRTPLAQTDVRDRQLQQDGFILSSAATIDPGHMRFSASAGSDGNWAAAASLSTDHDFQFDGIIEEYANNGSVPPTLNPTPGLSRWMAGGRIRVLDQNNGDAFSWTLRVLGGRDMRDQDVGVLFVAAPASYEVNDRLALTAAPAAGAFGNTEVFGLGLGANYLLGNNIQLIGEVTPVSDGSSPVWAAGARYTSNDGRFNVDLSATNSIGRYGIGTLVAQDDTRFSLGVSFDTRIFSR